MSKPIRELKFRGMLVEDDQIHAAQDTEDKVIAPHKVPIPGGKFVPQYSPTVRENKDTAYDPAVDCGGNFMSYKFQPNNNCYNYACDIATNSFAQPGRKNGILLQSPPSGEQVRNAAEADGLEWLGTTYQSTEVLAGHGHVVALVISPGAPDLGWPGDYHWVRYDKGQGSWSQKDGGDQVTNFDFSGRRISDPAKANWQVNQGPSKECGIVGDDVIVNYEFFGYMRVPPGRVDII